MNLKNIYKIIIVALIFIVPSLSLSQTPSYTLSNGNDEILQNANYCFSSVSKARTVQVDPTSTMGSFGGINVLCGGDNINLGQGLIHDIFQEEEDEHRDARDYVESFGVMRSTSFLTEWFYKKGFVLMECDNAYHHSFLVETRCIYHKDEYQQNYNDDDELESSDQF